MIEGISMILKLLEIKYIWKSMVEWVKDWKKRFLRSCLYFAKFVCMFDVGLLVVKNDKNLIVLKKNVYETE